jgi:hypothetical protein
MVTGQVVKVSFSGGNSSFADGNQLPGKMNYFVGNVPSKWTTNVPRFAGATAQHMLPGLDVRYYFDQGSPRYDLILGPGADPSSIAMNFEGANSLSVLPNGNLQIETSIGPIVEKGLVAYQQQGSTRISVPCQMAVTGSTVHFHLADYDKSKPLVIDPLVFCTYWYANDEDEGIESAGPESVCADASGSIVTVGHVDSKTFPTTSGAYQTANISYFGAGYVSKLSSDGKQLIFGSYLSGTALNAGDTDGDGIIAVTTDASGGIYMTGRARSSDFPITPGAIQSTNPSAPKGYSNVFITKMTPEGSQLAFSTFWGGGTYAFNRDYFPTGEDYGSSISLDSSGNIIVAGHAASTDFPVTTGSYQTFADPNDVSRGFVLKLKSAGNSVVFSTLVPGGAVESGVYNSNYGPGQSPIAKIDSSDNILLGGFASSTYFAATPNHWNFAGGRGYVAKLTSDGKKIIFATLLPEGISSIDVTPGDGVVFESDSYYDGYVYWPIQFDMAGTYHWPGTPHTFFCLGQFSSDGTTLVHSAIMSYLPRTMRTDKAGNIYLYGPSGPGLPTTAGAFQSSAGTYYLAEISPEQDKLLYATYFSNSSGNLYNTDTFALVTINRAALLGNAIQGTVPITAGAYNTTSGPSFVAVLTLPIFTHVELTPNPVVGGQTVTGKVTIPGPAAPLTGYVISLSSSDTGVKVPASVTVPYKAISQTFTITTSGVAVNTNATISATFAGGTGTAQLVRTPASLLSVVASPSPVVAGQTTTGTVNLNGLAGAGGYLVQLSSSSVNVTVPASAVIFNGSGMATFQIKTAVAAASYTGQITAKLGTVTKALQLEVDPGLSSLTVSSPSVVAGASAQGVAMLSGKAGAAGAVIALSSSSAATKVPASVSIPAGASLAAFTITTVGVDAATVATITAKEGALIKTATLTVQPAVLSFLTLTPASVKGGTGLQGIARLNGPAGPSGVSVTLSSTLASVTLPSKGVIVGGASYFVFVIGTKPVTQATSVTIKATSGVTISAPLTVNP